MHEFIQDLALTYAVAQTETVAIRVANAADTQAICDLAAEAASIEEKPLGVCHKTLLRDAFGDPRRCSFLVAEKGEELIAFALFYPGYEFETASWGMHVGYVLVTEKHRHKRIAGLMMRELERITKKQGGNWISWTIPSSYKFAKRMYRSFKEGGRPADDMQLSVTSFRRFDEDSEENAD